MAITEVDKAGAESEAEAKPARRRLFSMKTAMVLAALIALGGGGVGLAYQFGYLEAGPEAAAVQAPKLYYQLPEFTVNLSGTEERPQYLRMRVALEAGDQAAIDAVEPRLPRIVDIFQVYLRELRVSDLEGSAGLYRLREELVRRVNLTIAPRAVDDVLFQEVLIQ